MVVVIARKNKEFCKNFNKLSRIVEGSRHEGLAAVPLAALSIGRRVKIGRIRNYLNKGLQGNEYSRQMERFLAKHYAEKPDALVVRLDDVRRFVAHVEAQGVEPAWRDWVKRYGKVRIGAVRYVHHDVARHYRF